MRQIKVFIPKNIFKYHTKTIYFEGILKHPLTTYCQKAKGPIGFFNRSSTFKTQI